jgi:hypothetical protein
MPDYEICCNLLGRPKAKFKTRKAAERAAARKHGIKIYVYKCPHCDGFHHSHEKPKNHVETPPSAKTLRGRLRNAALEIRACERRLAKMEQRKADAELRAAHILKASEFATELELRAIEALCRKVQR